jgi:hypothetical protein
MNFRIFCETCNKYIKVSNHDAIKYEDENNMIIYSFGCPLCNNEIGAIGINQERKKL